MKFTLSWLKEHLETSATAEEISIKLTSLGLEVDSVINPGDDLADFTIAHIQTAERHPNADKLQVCRVDTGSEVLQIVCGAPNARAGLKVVLATLGTLIPSNGMVLKPTKIRDVDSQGMLCSAAELCLSDEATGIMELPSDAPIGASYAEYAGFNNPIFDLEITPNRGDCLGIRGIARDLAAAGLGTLKPLSPLTFKEDGECSITVALDFPQGKEHICPLFTGRVIRNVNNGPSPAWLQAKIKALGMRPISTLVDITNLITFDIGRPLHVFDLSKIKGNTLRVRMAADGESCLALDEKTYTFTDQMAVISDDSGVVGVAGIMGGASTGCDENTTDVFLESAYFDAITVALTGRRLGIHSDARYRFERGVDPEMVKLGMDRGAQLILDLCGTPTTTISKVMISGSKPIKEQTVSFDPSTVKSRGGVTTDLPRMKQILIDLGFQVNDTKPLWSVSVPTWRFDVDGPESLVEEICRVVGYDSIEEAPLPSPTSDEFYESAPGSLQNQKRRDIARRLLAARGLCECNTWSFMEESRARLFGGGDASLKLLNPLSLELAMMRPSLLTNLIAGAGRNKDRGLENSALFEVGAVYDPSFPMNQEMRIGGIRSDFSSDRHWAQKQRPIDLYDAKEDFIALLDAFGISPQSIQLVPEAPDFYHPGRSATVYLGPKTMLGTFGELHPQILKDMGISGCVVGFELYLDRFPVTKTAHKKKLLSLSSLQPIHRDFAFLMDQSVPAEKITKAALKVDKALITNAQIFDVYQGKGIPDGKKSVAMTVTFEPAQKTLTDDEINALMNQIIQAVSKDTGGELRA